MTDRSPIPLRPVTDTERACAKCGAPTSSKSGLCRGCHNGYGLPDPTRVPTHLLIAYVAKVREELHRRRDELNAALNGEP